MNTLAFHLFQHHLWKNKTIQRFKRRKETHANKYLRAVYCHADFAATLLPNFLSFVRYFDSEVSIIFSLLSGGELWTERLCCEGGRERLTWSPLSVMGDKQTVHDKVIRQRQVTTVACLYTAFNGFTIRITRCYCSIGTSQVKKTYSS